MSDAEPIVQEHRKHARWLWLAVAIVVAWQLFGAFPPSPLESDGSAVALGAAQRLTDPAHCPEIAYNFHGTSGTYVVLGGVWQRMHGDIFALYGVLTALAAVVGFTLVALFVARRLQVSVPLTALLIALLLPEFLAGAWFANTNIFALVPMALALLLTLRPGWQFACLTGLALGIAGWMRGDLAAEALGVAALLFRGDWRKRQAWLLWLRDASLCAVVSGVTALGLMTASGASLAMLLKTVGGVAGWASPTSGSGLPVWLVGHITFAPVATYLLLAVALVVLLRERRWSNLLPVLGGATFWWIIVAPFLATPKGLLNIVPFLALALVYAAHWLWSQPPGPWRWTGHAILATLVLQSLIGVRVTMASKPWLKQDGPALLSLWQGGPRGPLAKIEVVLGSGTIVPTDDGVRLASGTLFAPWVSHQRHVEREAAMASLQRILEAREVAPAIVSQMVEGATNARLALARAGYRCVASHREPQTGAVTLDYERPTMPGRITTRTSQVLLEDSKYALATLAPLHLHRALYVIASGRELQQVRAQAPEGEVLLDSVDFLPVAAIAYDQSAHDQRGPQPQ